MVRRAIDLSCTDGELKKIHQYNGGWKASNPAITSLQVAHDEIQRIEFNYKNMVLYDYKYAANFGGYRCSDHHLHNLFDKSTDHLNTHGGEKVFQDCNQVYGTSYNSLIVFCVFER